MGNQLNMRYGGRQPRSNLTPEKVFISCRFPPSGLTEVVSQMAAAIGMQTFLADRPTPKTPRDKVLEMMAACDATIFILEHQTREPSLWQAAELGIALSLNHSLGFIYGPGVPPEVVLHDPARDLEPLRLRSDGTSAENHVAVVAYLAALKAHLDLERTEDRERIDPVTYDSAVWAVNIDLDGSIEYNVRHSCIAQQDGVADLDHFMNPNHTLPDPLRVGKADVQLVTESDNASRISLTEPSGDDRVFRFNVTVDPPLSYGEKLVYEYVVKPNNGKITRQWWLARREPVRHMFTVVHPMTTLTLSVTTHLGVPIAQVETRAYVGQLMASPTESHRESKRSAEGLHRHYARGRAFASVTIDRPLVGYTYALEWMPSWNSLEQEMKA